MLDELEVLEVGVADQFLGFLGVALQIGAEAGAEAGADEGDLGDRLLGARGLPAFSASVVESLSPQPANRARAATGAARVKDRKRRLDLVISVISLSFVGRALWAGRAILGVPKLGVPNPSAPLGILS